MQYLVNCRTVRMRRFAYASILAAASGGFSACHVSRPPVESDAERLTGIQNPIAFHESSEAFDATVAIPGSMRLEDAVRLSLTHDPRIQIALARVRAAEADAKQARLLPNPILNIDIRIPNQPGINTAVEATLTGDLVSLLQKPGAIAAADKRLRASASDALVVTLDIIAEVQQSYASIQAAGASISPTGGTFCH